MLRALDESFCVNWRHLEILAALLRREQVSVSSQARYRRVTLGRRRAVRQDDVDPDHPRVCWLRIARIQHCGDDPNWINSENCFLCVWAVRQ